MYMMKATARALVRRVAPAAYLRYKAFRLLIADEGSYLYLTGWMRSLADGRPSSPSGQPVPWMNYPVVQLLAERLTRDCRVFEYGSGFSTAFYAGLAGAVRSVEYDEAWRDIVARTLPDNARVAYVPKDVDGRYCRSIAESAGAFDLVVVDGWDRVNCVRCAVERLSARGVVVLDDSDRGSYIEAFDLMKSRGFRSLSLSGLKPTGVGREHTTIFYRDGNCLGL
jgi:hypothetical protein